ncbi:conserved Plasmodium protein, unknown function [Plasmodium chabaudi chabaudi]|uniref:Uncharacterized protein n=1 Tax=Plasmodium chabaudi chabaudi TaxID=31271 RepID=A0A1C6XM68_PLACU|nr:conserved Plasmodium protein, unknown function [Plasmodium chabaudi chabaudi]
MHVVIIYIFEIDNIVNINILKKMVKYIEDHPHEICLLVSLVFVFIEMNKNHNNFISVYLLSFISGVCFNKICKFNIKDIKSVDLFLNKILAYTLCISLMITFSFLKKKKKKKEKEKKNIASWLIDTKNKIIYSEEKKSVINKLLIQSRFLYFGIAFIFGMVGTIVGGIISYYIIKIIFNINNTKNKDTYLKRSVCCFISTYIGGHINLIEIAELLKLNNLEKNSIFILDDFFTNLFLMMLPLFKKYSNLLSFPNDKNLQKSLASQIKQNKKNNDILNSQSHNDETRRLILYEPKEITYGSFIYNNENNNFEKNLIKNINSEHNFVYKMFRKIIYDSLSIMFIIILTEQILTHYELLHKIINLYIINVVKIKAFLLFSITFIYLFFIDYIIQTVSGIANCDCKGSRLIIYTQKIIEMIRYIYFRSIEYYSTVLNFLFIYYLFFLGILININSLFAISKSLAVLVISMLIIHLFCAFFLSYIYNNLCSKNENAVIHIDEILLAINANIGGPTTATIMSELFKRHDLTFVSTLWGIIGYFIATDISMIIYQRL